MDSSFFFPFFHSCYERTIWNLTYGLFFLLSFLSFLQMDKYRRTCSNSRFVLSCFGLWVAIIWSDQSRTISTSLPFDHLRHFSSLIPDARTVHFLLPHLFQTTLLWSLMERTNMTHSDSQWFMYQWPALNYHRISSVAPEGRTTQFCCSAFRWVEHHGTHSD